MLGIGLGHAELAGEDPEGIGGAFEADGDIPRGILGELLEALVGGGDGKPFGAGDFQAQGFATRPQAGFLFDAAVLLGQEFQRPAQTAGHQRAGGALQAAFHRPVGHGVIPPLVVLTFKDTAKSLGLQGREGGCLLRWWDGVCSIVPLGAQSPHTRRSPGSSQTAGAVAFKRKERRQAPVAFFPEYGRK